MRLIFVILFVTQTVRCARILGVFSIPWHSHFVLGETLFKELAARGHEVTVISSIPQKENVKNYRDITITELNDEIERLKNDGTCFKSRSQSRITFVTYVYDTFTKFTDLSLQNENVQRLLRSNETFDLIILQQLINEAYFGFMHRFKAPVVLVATLSASQWSGTLMGNPVPYSYMPHLYIGYSSKMNFWQRMHNTFLLTFDALYLHFVNLPRQNEILQKYFADAPPIEDLMYNASVLLINNHPTIGAAVPLQPNIVQIGGFHIKKHEPLSASLQQFLDEAKEGVVYFSMGSFLRSARLPKETIREILNAFSKLEMKVLWKWEKDELPGKPVNVRTEKWLSQLAVLAHKNVKVFITHGGLLSVTEAIYFGKPILGIPIFSDQVNNIKEAVNNIKVNNIKEAELHGYGVHLPYSDLNEQNLLGAVREIVGNPRYTETAKYRSNALHDLQIKPLDKAIHWIEYAIKYRDLPHLKNASLNLRWYQLLLLDVFLFCLIALWILKRGFCILLGKVFKVEKEKLKTN